MNLLKFSVLWPRTLSQDQGQGQGLGTRERGHGQGLKSEDKNEDKDPALCLWGTSRTRTSPRGHITGSLIGVMELLSRFAYIFQNW